MRWPALAVLVLLAAAPAAAQPSLGSATGTVRDSVSGAPLGGAEVSIGPRRALTNGQGVFRVDSLHAGRHPLAIRMLGYAPVRARVDVVAGTPTRLAYAMTAAPYYLPTNVVASRREGIFGVVGDTGYRKAVGARVQLAGPRRGDVHTDSAGRFAFPGAAHGDYVVRVTYPGHTERRVLVTLDRGEGRELSILLAPSSRQPSLRENVAIVDLGERLAKNLRREHLTEVQLARFGSAGFCDVKQITQELGEETTVVVNGSDVYRNVPTYQLCAWRADEMQLVEFARNACRDLSGTIAQLVGAPSPAMVMRGGIRVQRDRCPYGSFVVLWEKR